MTRADWALVTQVVSSAAAAVAAVFAWLAARRVKKDQEYERRVRATEQLKMIYRLITDLVEMAHRNPDQAFGPSMRLRSELAVAYATPLPKCIELVDKWHGETMTVDQLDLIAPAALAEVQAAHAVVWRGRMETFTYTPSEETTGNPED